MVVILAEGMESLNVVRLNVVGLDEKMRCGCHVVVLGHHAY